MLLNLISEVLTATAVAAIFIVIAYLLFYSEDKAQNKANFPIAIGVVSVTAIAWTLSIIAAVLTFLG